MMVKTDETQSMLKAILNSHASFRQEFLSSQAVLTKRFDQVDRKIDGVEERLSKRIDSAGKQLAYLEDDAPTGQEFDGLEKRVEKLERKPVSAH